MDKFPLLSSEESQKEGEWKPLVLGLTLMISTLLHTMQRCCLHRPHQGEREWCIEDSKLLQGPQRDSRENREGPRRDNEYSFSCDPTFLQNQRIIYNMCVSEFQSWLLQFSTTINPDTLFVPFPDRHIDHRIVFDSSIVASRPVGKKFPKNIKLIKKFIRV